MRSPNPSDGGGDGMTCLGASNDQSSTHVFVGGDGSRTTDQGLAQPLKEMEDRICLALAQQVILNHALTHILMILNHSLTHILMILNLSE